MMYLTENENITSIQILNVISQECLEGQRSRSLSSHPSNFCEFAFTMRCYHNFFKLTRSVHLNSRMNIFDLDCQRSRTLLRHVCPIFINATSQKLQPNYKPNQVKFFFLLFSSSKDLPAGWYKITGSCCESNSSQ